MPLSPLTAISPIDGRYHSKTEILSGYFSEYALMKYRLKVEVRYFHYLSQKGFFKIPAASIKKVRAIEENFSVEDAQQVKEIEKVTNHDVKAIEYFLKNKLKDLKLEKVSEWVHFGLTSQDINNTAFPMMWKDALSDVYLSEINEVLNQLRERVDEWKDIPMLARTHGQPASPTRLGKEFNVFYERINDQLKQFRSIPFTGKFGGATGNFNAHYVAFPKYNWKRFADDFLKTELGLQRQQHTTQIEHYDSLAGQFDLLRRVNTILIDLCRDVWTYVSMEYFKQKVKKNEVGSSAMPHKVNPIDFENAEGNLGLANAIFEHLSAKLPISRLQRDLTDSTVLRNIGVPLAHTLIALKSLEKGLNKIILHQEKLESDLENNWAVVAEAIQTILRRENYPNPYEALKNLTRGNEHISRELIHSFINTLNISAKIKKELKAITPQNYLGR